MTAKDREFWYSVAERIAAVVGLVLMLCYVDRQGFDPGVDTLKVGLVAIILGGPEALRTMRAKKKEPKE